MRALLSLFILALAAMPVLAQPAVKGWKPKSGDVIRFKVLREGKPFGSHAVRFETTADGKLIARTEVSLRAALGPVTLFRYRLDATETWLKGSLLEVSGEVNDDGKRRSVTARRDGGALKVAGSDFTGTAPAGIIPASHWNFEQTKASRLLSTEDGEILNVNVYRLGRERIKAGGETIDAEHFRLDSELGVDLWYDDAGRWVKLAFVVRGQQIEYVLDSIYGALPAAEL